MPYKTTDEYIKQQAKRSKPREYKNIRNRVVDAADWLGRQINIPNGFTGLSVLDLGTRDGWLLDYLKGKGVEKACGVELVGSVANHAKSKNRHVIQGDMHCLPYDNEQFELVTSIHSLEHTLHPQLVFSEMVRVCKPGGWMYVVVPKERRRRKGRNYYTHNQFYSNISLLISLVCGSYGIDANTIQTNEAAPLNDKLKPKAELRIVVQKRSEPL